MVGKTAPHFPGELPAGPSGTPGGPWVALWKPLPNLCVLAPSSDSQPVDLGPLTSWEAVKLFHRGKLFRENGFFSLCF